MTSNMIPADIKNMEKNYDSIHLDRTISELYYQLAQSMIILLIGLLMAEVVTSRYLLVNAELFLKLAIIFGVMMRIFQLTFIFITDEVNSKIFGTLVGKKIFTHYVFTILVFTIIIALIIMVIAYFQQNGWNWFPLTLLIALIGVLFLIPGIHLEHKPSQIMGSIQIAFSGIVFLFSPYWVGMAFVLSISFYLGNLITLKQLRMKLNA